MSFKIVPWLLLLSIAFAYAIPVAEKESEEKEKDHSHEDNKEHSHEEDKTHIHDEKCGHPIRDAAKKVKDTVSNAYNSAKAKVVNAIHRITGVFEKPTTKDYVKGTVEEITTHSYDHSEDPHYGTSDKGIVENSGFTNEASFPSTSDDSSVTGENISRSPEDTFQDVANPRNN